MKILSLILSIIVFFASGYFFITDMKVSTDTNYFIYMTLLVILMLICIIGILINISTILQYRKRIKTFMYNSYSKKPILNKNF